MKFIIALALAGIGSCAGNSGSVEIRPAQVITIPEDYDFRFDARNGDTVIVILNPRPIDEMLKSCDEMGGELIANSFTEIWTCEKVDF